MDTGAVAAAMPDTAEWELVREEARPAGPVSPWRSRAPASLFDEVLRRPSIEAEDADEEEGYGGAALQASAWRRLCYGLIEDLRQELVHGRPFLFLPVLIGLGAIWWFTRPQDLPRLPIVIAFCAAGSVWVRVRFRHPLLGLAFGIATLGLSGMLLADAETSRLDTIIIDSPVTTEIRGRVLSSEPNASGNQRYVIALQQTRYPSLKRMPQQVALLARGRHDLLKPGDWMEGRARLSPPSGPALPGLNDFAFASYFEGIGAIGYFYQQPKRLEPDAGAASPALFERAGNWLQESTEDVRNAISNRIRALVPGDAGAFAVAIVTGERRGLSEKANNDLRVSGLAHIISISGLHMALAGGLFFVGIRRLLSLVPGMAEAWPIKKIAAAGAIATTTGYFLISGYDIAAQRAYLMMVIMLSAAFFDRPVLSLRNAALAAFLVILLSPSQVMGPSLQMSFAATFALIAGFDLWRRRPRLPALLPPIPLLAPLKRLGTMVAGSLMTSALGGVSTAIFSAAHFHRVGLHGLEANLFAAPIISMLVMPAAMIGVLLMPFGLDRWPIEAMGLGLDAVLAIASEVATWGAGFTFGRFEWWFLPLSATGLMVLALMKTRLRLIGLAMMLIAFVYETVKSDPPLPDLAVTEDGQLFAILRQGDRNMVSVATNKARPPGFLFSQWRSVIDIADPIAPEMLPRPASDGAPAENGKARPKKKASEREQTGPKQAIAEMQAAKSRAATQPDVFHCRTNGFCLARLSSGWTVSLVQNRDFAQAACQLSDLVVAPQVNSAQIEAANAGFDQAAQQAPRSKHGIMPQADAYTACMPTSPPVPRPLTSARTETAEDEGPASYQEEWAQAASDYQADRGQTGLPPSPSSPDGAHKAEHSKNQLSKTAHQQDNAQSAEADPVSSIPLHPPVVLTRDDLRHFGAMEITLGDPAARKLLIQTAFKGEYRPWTRHRYFDWRSNRYEKPSPDDRPALRQNLDATLPSATSQTPVAPIPDSDGSNDDPLADIAPLSGSSDSGE